MMTKFKTNFISNKRVESVGFINQIMLPAWFRLLIWSLQIPKNPYMLLASRLIVLWKANGPKHLVLYLKEATRITQAYISGNPVLVSEFPISLKGGLPSIIPGCIRSEMRRRDLVSFRAVLSALAVYRVILIPGNLKLSTITEPFKGQRSTLPEDEIKESSSEIFNYKVDYTFKPIRLLLLGTAGPNHAPSMFGIWKDIIAWKESSLFPTLEKYLHRVPGGQELLQLINSEYEFIKDKLISPDKPYILGKLSEKVEAAGKIRVFAITDSITQSCLGPLSDCIFKILRRLPMDGTFDQDSPVRHLRDLYLSGDLKGETFYSYDLSAATDRLPINFQVQVLSRLVGDELAGYWKEILCNRDWYHKGKPLRYSVGQPMGALSSWAMLALSHHVVVRIAANRVGLPYFTNYALLGDDIVIANTMVAKAYHNIMTKTLGVEINLSKSMISEHSFEFAKRIITMDGEVSAVGPKNLLVGLKTMKGIPSILLDLTNKGVRLSEESVTNLYKSIPTVRKSQLERLMWLVKGPFGFIPTTDGLSADLQLYDSLSVICIDRLADSFDQAIFEQNSNLWARNLKKMDDIYASLLCLESIPGISGDFQLSPLYNHILSIYWEKAMRLVSDRPGKPDYSNGFGVIKLKHWGSKWKVPVMKELTAKLHEDLGATVLPLDPFRVDRTILPLSHSVKAENFWSLAKEIIVKRSSFKFSGDR